MHRYITWNGVAPGASSLAKVTTGSAGTPKTMLQLATPSTRMIQLIAWGYELDAVPGSTGGQIEIGQFDTGATITQHVAAGIMPLQPGIPNSLLDISSTTKTGYSASGEGSPTTSRIFGVRLIPPTAGATDLSRDYEFMPDARPVVDISKFLRIRVNFAAAVNMSCYIVHDE